jgi:hypothetical protein
MPVVQVVVELSLHVTCDTSGSACGLSSRPKLPYGQLEMVSETACQGDDGYNSEDSEIASSLTWEHKVTYLYASDPFLIDLT